MAGGRPPILKECARCRAKKPRRAYVNATAEVCIECRREIRDAGGPQGVQAVDLAYTANLEARPVLLMDPKVKDPIMDMIKLDAMNEAMAKLIKPMPRCICCWETRHVALDGYGGIALVCRRCEHQILHTGTCHLHHSKIFYPELDAEHRARVVPLWKGNDRTLAVPSPPEIEGLFYVPESEKPKYDAAELADADV